MKFVELFIVAKEVIDGLKDNQQISILEMIHQMKEKITRKNITPPNSIRRRLYDVIGAMRALEYIVTERKSVLHIMRAPTSDKTDYSYDPNEKFFLVNSRMIISYDNNAPMVRNRSSDKQIIMDFENRTQISFTTK